MKRVFYTIFCNLPILPRFALYKDIPDDDVAFVNMSIRESKWRQITKIQFAKLIHLPYRPLASTCTACVVN
jgi:hypothetical protein